MYLGVIAVTARYASIQHSVRGDIILTLNIQTLAPIYEQLADAFSHASDKVLVAKVDADGDGKETGSKFGVTGFPSKPRHLTIISSIPLAKYSSIIALKWFNADGTDEKYEGGRDLDTLAALYVDRSTTRVDT